MVAKGITSSHASPHREPKAPARSAVQRFGQSEAEEEWEICNGVLGVLAGSARVLHGCRRGHRVAEGAGVRRLLYVDAVRSLGGLDRPADGTEEEAVPPLQGAGEGRR